MVRKNIAENMREVYQHYRHKKAEELQTLSASLSLSNDLLDDEADTDMGDPSENDAEDLNVDANNSSVLLELQEANEDEVGDMSGALELDNTITCGCDNHLVYNVNVEACNSVQSLDAENTSLCENIEHRKSMIPNKRENASIQEQLQKRMDAVDNQERRTDSTESSITGVISNSESNGGKHDGEGSHLRAAENAGKTWNMQSGSDHGSANHPNAPHPSSSCSISDDIRQPACQDHFTDMQQSQYPTQIAHRNTSIEIFEGYLELTGTASSDLNTTSDMSDTESFTGAEEEIMHNSIEDEGLHISEDSLAMEEGLEANCKTLSQVLVTEMIAIPQRKS